MKKLLLFITALTVGNIANAQIANAGLESWRTSSAGSLLPKIVRAPISWYGSDSLIIATGQSIGTLLSIDPSVWQTQLFKDSTTVHGGTYSAKLVTKDQDTLGIFPGTLSNCENHVIIDMLSGTVDFYQTGGTPVTERVVSVSAWVNYQPASGSDTASLTIQALGKYDGADTTFGFGGIPITATTGWVQVTANMTYTTTSINVDTLRITFASSGGASMAEGSTLFVDDVTMVTEPQSVQTLANSKVVKVYPNPANDMLYVEANNYSSYICKLIANDGRVVATATIDGKTGIDISALPSGNYSYIISNMSGVAVQNGKVAIAK